MENSHVQQQAIKLINSLKNVLVLRASMVVTDNIESLIDLLISKLR